MTTFVAQTDIQLSMAKYLILSDIHGSLPALEKALKLFSSEHCDYLCILGDILNYGPRNRVPEGMNAMGIAELLNGMAERVLAIRGNCDSEVDQMLLDFPMMQDFMMKASDCCSHMGTSIMPIIFPRDILMPCSMGTPICVVCRLSMIWLYATQARSHFQKRTGRQHLPFTTAE